MTYQLTTFYCHKCKTGTPHEFDNEAGRARCTICADKQISAAAELRLKKDTALEQHLAALDGYTNEGERRRARK